MSLPHSMFLVTFHNPLQGVSFRVVGVADTLGDAQRATKHYYAGTSQEWVPVVYNGTEMWIRKVDPGAGIQYVIQEVRVL